MQKTRSPLSFFSVLALAVLLAAIGCSGGDGGKKRIRDPKPVGKVPGRALLVGISEYMVEKDLKGPKNDLKMMRDLLVNRLGFQPEKILVLKDEQATYAAIYDGIASTLKAAEKDETVLIYFSCHGSQVPDVSGDETDGFDESIIPHDGRQNNVPDLTDDVLASELSFYGKPTVVIMDTCYSGSGTRGVATRAVERDPRGSEFYASHEESFFEELGQRFTARVGTQGDGGVQGRFTPGLIRSVEIEEQHLLLGAADSTQKAIEVPIKGRWHGVFSYSLAQALEKNDPRMPIEELLRGPVTEELLRLREVLGSEGFPTPQLEGPAELQARMLFPLASIDRLHSAETRNLSGGRVEFDRGGFADIGPGAVFAVHAGGQSDFRVKDTLGVLAVEMIQGDKVVTKASGAIPNNSRAVQLLLAPADPMRVHLGDALSRTRMASLPALSGGRIELVETPEGGAYTMLESEDSAEFAGQEAFDVLTSDGVLVVTAFGSSGLAAELSGFFVRMSEARAFLSLQNPSSALGLRFVLEEYPGHAASLTMKGGARGLKVHLDVQSYEPHPPLAEPGDPADPKYKNSLMTAVRARSECFVTLVHVDANGDIEQLFPVDAETSADGGGEGLYEPDGVIESGDWNLLPPKLNPYECWPLLGMQPGLANVVAIATTDKKLAEAIRAYVAGRKGDPDGDPAASVRVLREKLAQEAWTSGADWDVTSVTYRLETP